MYHFKKEKAKIIDRLKNWEDLLYNGIIEMFTYKGYEKGDFFRLFTTLESILINNGNAGIIELNNKLFAGRVSFTGNLDEFGDLTDAIVFTENGKTYTFKNWRENENIVIIHNNYLELGDNETIERYASILADIDKSIKHNVIFSRLNKFLVARNETEKKQLEEMLNQNENGKLGVVVGEVDDWDENGTQIYTADITDVENADKIQYLNKCHDDIIRRLATIYGVSMNNNTSKMAQQSVEEITSGEDLSKIYPIIKLKCRLLGIKEVNKKFGTNISVTFSEAWDSILKNEEKDNPKNTDLEEIAEEQPTEETKESEESADGSEN